MRYLPLLLLVSSAYAQKPVATPPVIPDKLMKEYYHALANKLNAQVMVQSTPQYKALDKAQDDLNLQTQIVANICGEKYGIENMANGDPRCVDKPVPPAPPAPAPAAPTPAPAAKKPAGRVLHPNGTSKK